MSDEKPVVGRSRYVRYDCTCISGVRDPGCPQHGDAMLQRLVPAANRAIDSLKMLEPVTAEESLCPRFSSVRMTVKRLGYGYVFYFVNVWPHHPISNTRIAFWRWVPHRPRWGPIEDFMGRRLRECRRCYWREW